MICPKCSAQNMDGVTFCGSCGAQMASFTPPSTPVEPQQAVNYSQPQSYQQPQNQQQQPSYGSPAAGNVNPNQFTSPLGGTSNGGLVQPKNYLTEAIIVTVVSVLCCSSIISLILGIFAIIKANNVNTEFARGNIIEANKNADAAKKLTIWAAVIAVIMFILLIVLFFVILGAGFAGLGGFDEILKNL